MGCSTSTTSLGEAAAKHADNEANASSSRDLSSDSKYPASEAFIIPLDNDTDSLEDYNPQPSEAVSPGTAKKLPKRLKQLMEQAAASDPPPNLDNLEDKLNKAELRRKEYLQQKIENIQKTTQMLSRTATVSPPGAPDAPGTPAAGNAHRDMATTTTNEIKSKALDDDSKQQLLMSTLRS